MCVSKTKSSIIFFKLDFVKIVSCHCVRLSVLSTNTEYVWKSAVKVSKLDWMNCQNNYNFISLQYQKLWSSDLQLTTYCSSHRIFHSASCLWIRWHASVTSSSTDVSIQSNYVLSFLNPRKFGNAGRLDEILVGSGSSISTRLKEAFDYASIISNVCLK